MKKLVLVLVVLGVLGVLLIGGLLYADGRALEFAEREAERRVAAALPGSEDIEVTIEQWPLLLAVFTGEIDGLRITAGRVARGGVTAQDLQLEVRGIALDTGVLFDEQRLVVTGIDHARLTGTMTQEAVSKAVKAPVEFKVGMVKVTSAQGRSLVATLAVKGRKIRLVPPLSIMKPLEFDMPPRELLPCEPELEVLEGKLALGCEVDALPDAVMRAIGQR